MNQAPNEGLPVKLIDDPAVSVVRISEAKFKRLRQGRWEIVADRIGAVGGSVSIRSVPGAGTTWRAGRRCGGTTAQETM